jgi:putative transposase
MKSNIEMLGDGQTEVAMKKTGGRGKNVLGSDYSASRKYEIIDNEMDQKIIALYAKGLTTSDIANYLKENHGMSISQSAISTVTDKVYPLIKEWQARPLSSVYTLLYLDGLRFKVRDAGKIVNKCAYIILGIDTMGHKEVLGFWIAETEGAKFWMQILSELQHRGVEEILIACIDGLRGFGEAIKAIYPDAIIQHCIVHQVRHTIKFVSHKDLDPFCKDLKTVYTAPSEEAGKEALAKVQAKWQKYLPFLKTWDDKWPELVPFFSYPEALRRAMYTTNVIENLNRQFRKVTKTTVVFPHDESLVKLLWLAQDDIAKRWTMPIHNWGEIVSQLAILFPDKIEF